MRNVHYLPCCPLEEAVTVSVIVNPCVLEMALDPFLRSFHLEQFGLLSKDLGGWEICSHGTQNVDTNFLTCKDAGCN